MPKIFGKFPFLCRFRGFRTSSRRSNSFAIGNRACEVSNGVESPVSAKTPRSRREYDESATKFRKMSVSERMPYLRREFRRRCKP